MKNYPEIAQLASLRKQFTISIQVTNAILGSNSWFPKVHVNIGAQSYEMYVEDEYEDFKIDNPDLHLCLILRSLEFYNDCEDFLVWCKQLGVDVADPAAREHHLELGAIYSAIEKQLGTINSYINDYDFELNAGAAQVLREEGKL